MSAGRWQTIRASVRLVPSFLILGVAKHVIPLRTLVRWTWRGPRGPVAADARTIAAQVLRVGAIVGVPDRDCLQRSLLLYREMAAAGLTPELVVGFRKHSGSIAGHAWVRCEGIVLTEPPDELSEFDTALVFGARGELT